MAFWKCFKQILNVYIYSDKQLWKALCSTIVVILEYDFELFRIYSD